MADKIRGITIEIGGDTTGLSKALKGINTEVKSTQKQLKDVEKLLKLDPTNTELLKQKQELLGKAVKETSSKLEELKKLQDTMDQNGVDKNSEQYMALQREIIATDNELEKLEKSARESNAAFQKISAELGNISNKASIAAQKTKGISTAAAGVLTAIGGVAYSAITASDDLNTMAKQTGFTTAELQKMKYASDLIDVSLEDITGSISKMRRNMVSNSADTQEAFRKIGVSVTDVNGNLRDSTEVFYEVLEGLSKVANETERDTIAMQIFGKSADQLAGIVDDGGEALKRFGKQAEEAGLILSQETLDSLNEVNDKIDTMKATLRGTLAEIGAKAAEVLFPVIERILERIMNILDVLSNVSPKTLEIVLIITAALAILSPLLTLIGSITRALMSIIPVLSSITAAVISNPILLVIAAISAAVIALVVLIVKNWDEIKALFDYITQFISEKVTIIKDAIVKAAQFAFEVVKSIGEGIANVFKAIVNAVITMVENAINRVISGINNIIMAFNSVVSAVASIIGATYNGISMIQSVRLPRMAKGGILSEGTALVGEAGPELLTMLGNKAMVTPLTESGSRSAPVQAANTTPTPINVSVEFTGSLAHLGRVLQPVIKAETVRLGSSMAR